MSLRLELETDEAVTEHSAQDDEEEQLKKLLAKLDLEQDEYGDIQGKLEQKQKLKICSCGHYTCPMVKRYGHPLPVFQEDIEPLWPQYARDRKAIQLKQS